MPLHILLIDNSNTIKKAIEMALQDYGVDIKTLSTGVDIAHTVESFKPDIVFSDIMLREKSGYEVATELKALQNDLPVVLLWSEFMNFNDKKAKNSGAVAHLKKPFDKKQLLKIVKEHVKSLNSQNVEQQPSTEISISTIKSEEVEEDSFHHFVELPDNHTPKKVSSLSDTDPNTPEKDENSSSDVIDSTEVVWSIDESESASPPQAETKESELPELAEEKDDFVQSDLNALPPLESQKLQTEKSPLSLEQDNSEKDSPEIEIPSIQDTPQPPPISHRSPEEKEDEDGDEDYKIDVPEENVDFDEMTVGFTEPADDKKSPSLDKTEILPIQEKKLQTKEQVTTQTTPPDKNVKVSPTTKPLSEKELRKILGEQSREVIEKIVWQLVPDMASNIIREELNRLLDDTDK